MNPPDSSHALRARCDELSRVVTAMHGDVSGLGDPNARAEILRALFELTKQIEVVKKHLIRVQKGDDSKLL